MKKITVLLTVLLLSLLASSAFAQEFTAAADASAAGWDWDSAACTLTLSDSASFESIILPNGAKIVIPVDKTLTVDASGATGTVAIQCPGALTIEGGGKLVVRSTDASGLKVKKLAASGIAFDVDADAEGILADGNGEDASVTLKNCTGSIEGYRGIDAKGASVNVDLKECQDLAVKGYQGNAGGVSFPQSGIRVVSNVNGEHEALINIEDCQNVTVSGGTAIAMDANTSADSEVNTPVSFNIKNSSVQINGSNTIYAAVFINNYSMSSDGDGDGSVNIVGSDVTISVPGGTGIMTSVHGQSTRTDVKLRDSRVNFIGNLGVKSEDSGANGSAGIDMENSIVRMELSGETPLIVVTKQDGTRPLPEEDKKGMLVVKTPTQNTVTLYEDITMAQDYTFPEDAEFVNAGNYALNVKPGVTLTIDGEEYYFPNGGSLVIGPDGTVQVVMAGNGADKAASSVSVPKTGDDSRVLLWLCLMAVSAMIFAVTARRKAAN